jgi:hypothetical protein
VADESAEFPVPEIAEVIPKRKTNRTASQLRVQAENLAKGRQARKDKVAERKAEREAPAKAAAAAVVESPDVRAVKTKARDSLRKWRAEIGAGGLLIAPVPATYVAQTPDDVIEAMVQLAGRNAKFLAAIAKGGDLLAAIVVLRWAAGLGVATGVQFERFAPDSALAQTFGVTDIVIDLEKQGVLRIEPIEPKAPEGSWAEGEGEPVRSVAPDFDGRPAASAVVAVP